MWLLSKGRKEEALQALCWLRGWVSEDKVKAEFEELCRYTEASKFTAGKNSQNKIYVEVPTKGYGMLKNEISYLKLCLSNLLCHFSPVCANGTGIVKPAAKSASMKLKIFDMFRPSMLRPFRLLLGYQISFHCAALSGLRCYMIETFSTLKMPVEPHWLAVSVACIIIVDRYFYSFFYIDIFYVTVYLR